MDGSEPQDLVAAAVISGAPIDLQARQVRCVRAAAASPYIRLTDLLRTESTGRRRRLPSLAHGTDIIGGWTGTYCTRDTDGRIR